MNVRLSSIVCAAGLAVLPGANLVSGQDDPARDDRGRRILDGEPTRLTFRNVTIDQLIPFIVEATGKVVMPQTDVLTRRVTVYNDRPIPRQQALDYVILALQQNGIAVVETADTITLRDINEIDRQDVPVLGPEESVLTRNDYGSIVEKVYRLRNSTAEAVGEMLEDSIPDYAKLTIDAESNQIAIMGNIMLLQRMERLIMSLDQARSDAVQTATFRLRYADAQQVKENIEELYASDGQTSGARGGNNQRNNPRAFFQRGGQQQEEQSGSSAPSENLRVTANTQQNSVTVVAEPTVIEQIRGLVSSDWDVPVEAEVVVPRVYTLEYTDPIKLADALTELLDEEDASRLAGQFTFEPIAASNQLVVLTKSPDNLKAIDDLIREIDRPQTVGLPAIIELKHTSAEELAEQLNTLLAQDGTIAQIRRSAEGLTTTSSAASPFSTEEDTADTTQQADEDLIQFWWQRSRPPTDARTPSNLISQLRIVPVWRQNALMVLAPPEYKASVIDLIRQLDQPGRQVLISAIVLAVAKDDATSLGFRWSSDAINLTTGENALRVGLGATAQENNIFGSIFDTSVLDASTDLNVVLQALAQNTGVNILSEPRIFTSDNQEAQFFDGQDIAFPVSTQTFDTGAVTQNTEYRAVGISLRARPRITPNQDVDLRVNVQVAQTSPGDIVNGNIVIARRETTTQLIVKNGQTVVISGIVRSEDTDIVRKVPILGDIPILNLFFKSIERTKVQSELIFFITPLVVDNTGELDQLNEPYQQRLDEQREYHEKDQKKK